MQQNTIFLDYMQQNICLHKMKSNISPDKLDQNIFPDTMQQMKMSREDMNWPNYFAPKLLYSAIASSLALQFFSCPQDSSILGDLVTH